MLFDDIHQAVAQGPITGDWVVIKSDAKRLRRENRRHKSFITLFGGGGRVRTRGDPQRSPPDQFMH